MGKNIRIHEGTLPPELMELLQGTRPVAEVQAELAREPLNLDRDPEFVADRLKADVVQGLLRALGRRGISQNELAERLNVTKQWVSRILNESDNFTVATMAKLACAVGMRPFINFADEDEVVRVMSRHSGPVKVEDIAGGDGWENVGSKIETALPIPHECNMEMLASGLAWKSEEATENILPRLSEFKEEARCA